MKLDGKFHGIVVKNKDQSVVPQDQWIVFLAKDDAVPAMLRAYEQACKNVGAGSEQMKAVQDLRERVKAWRYAHPELCKVPDTEPGEIIT
jgi:predicted ATP-grasp superfamily ATP-dependent carboligase